MIATKMHAGPQMNERRIDPHGEEWTVIGYGQIVNDYVVLLEGEVGEREHRLYSEFAKWRPVE